MFSLKRHLVLTTLTLACAFAGSVPRAHGSTRALPARFPALDGGQAVAPHVLVSALTTAPDGTLYAGGNYAVPNTSAYANSPVYALGSVWMVSHDHGATWSQRLSTTDPHAFPKSGVAPWTDHTAWPIDFTPAAITVDPHHPNVIYAAGCTDTGGHSGGRCAFPLGGPMVVRSTDGGQTWQPSLSQANIVNTPALRAAYQYSGAIPTQAYAVVVDPRNSQHLYAALSGLGVVSSADGGRTWTYVTQPQSNQTTRPCELVLDPRRPNTLYELDRAGALYRTTDSGAHWAVRSPLNLVVSGTSSSLTFVGTTLYVTAAKGIYASTDGGVHWQLRYPAPPTGGFSESVRDAAGWIAAFEPLKAGPVAGLYRMRDGQMWQPVADTDKRGPQYFGSLDFRTEGTYLVTRLWEDHRARVVFTAGATGGLYRWQAN